MGKGIEKSAKTVDEAIELALSDLELTREAVEVEILEEASKGIFGLFGGKQARVYVRPKADVSYARGKEFVETILRQMQVQASVENEVVENGLVIRITGEDVGILIGRRGETLEAFQYLVGLVVNKHADTYQKVFLDIEGYRNKREESLIRLAQRIAFKVHKTNKSVTLEPMPSNERRIIHSALQENGTVVTFSTGDEPFRKIVVRPKG
jgi:spoIIIJ-associated protein